MERILDDKTAADSKTLIGHSGPVYGASFNYDNSLLLTSSEDKTGTLSFHRASVSPPEYIMNSLVSTSGFNRQHMQAHLIQHMQAHALAQRSSESLKVVTLCNPKT